MSKIGRRRSPEQQLQQKIQAWEALLEKLGGNEWAISFLRLATLAHTLILLKGDRMDKIQTLGALPPDGVAVQADCGMRSPPVASTVRMPQLRGKVQDSSFVGGWTLPTVFYDVC